MPCHPDRVRRNYQDDGPGVAGVVETYALAWRRPSDTAAEQLERRAVEITDEGFTANVIEGDEH